MVTESNISNEATSVTVLPAPSSVSASYDSANDEVNISWTKADDSSDGSYTVQRSEDGGSTWTDVTTITTCQLLRLLTVLRLQGTLTTKLFAPQHTKLLQAVQYKLLLVTLM